MATNHELSQIKLGIVCPMANEIDSALAFVSQVFKYCQGFKSVSFFVVLDRVSTDGTLDLLLDLAYREDRLKVVWAPENRCVVDAYVRGYQEALNADCDWILEIDGGFSHQPQDIPRFFEAMLQGYDCVFGSRFCRGGKISDSSTKRHLISRAGTVTTNLLLGTRLKDMTSGFELFTANSLRYVLARGIQSRFHFFQTEIRVYCHALRIREVPIHYKAASPSVGTAALIDSLKILGRLFRMRLKGQLHGLPRSSKFPKPQKLMLEESILRRR